MLLPLISSEAGLSPLSLRGDATMISGVGSCRGGGSTGKAPRTQGPTTQRVLQTLQDRGARGSLSLLCRVSWA